VTRDGPVRVTCAFRISVTAAVTALALSGCMRRSAPVAAMSPSNELDAMTYGQPAHAPPPDATRSGLLTGPSSPGGLFGALRAAPRRAYAAVPVAYVAASPPVVHDAAYHLDAGDRLRIVIYGQEGLTNSYTVDAGGSITMPLIGAVSARGQTPAQLAAAITSRLRNGYIREPYVAAEIEAYRPFFILGEVAAPGQYPFVPNMSVESAVAIAGGFSPRAKRDRVTLTHTEAGGMFRTVVPLGTPLSPGDTIVVGERWF
jgi:polysaccharide export outer membrane protein